MRPHVDLAVINPSGQVEVLVEVKTTRKTDAEWATQFREHLLEIGAITPPTMFLLATPDSMYLWPSEGTPLSGTPMEVSTSEILDPYFRRTNTDPGTIGDEAFELIVRLWLGDVAVNRDVAGPYAEILHPVREGRVVSLAA